MGTYPTVGKCTGMLNMTSKVAKGGSSLWVGLILPSLIQGTSAILLCCRSWVGGWNSLCRAANSIDRIIGFVLTARLLYSSFPSGVPNKWHKILGDCSFSIYDFFPVLPTANLALSKLHPYLLKRIIPSWISARNSRCQRNSAAFLQCNCLP